jgi:hypothetical protein
VSKMDDLIKKAEEADKKTEQAQATFHERRQQYLTELDKLYKTVTDWMRPLMEKGLAEILSTAMVDSQDNNGKFKAPSLNFTVRNRKVSITPISWNVSGTAGGSVLFEISPNIQKAIALQKDGWIVFEENSFSSLSKPFTQDSLAEILSPIFN